MWFLITNVGNEDIVLGYPWLSTFKPQFNWTHTVINEQALPIVIWSVNPQIPGKDPIVGKIMTGDVQIQHISHSDIQATTATDLAIMAQQYTKHITMPCEYQQFAKVFSKEESK